jgi:hypothetical protein
MKQVKNLVGKKFGKLLVIKECGRNAFGHVLWECLCDCGNNKIASSNKLTYYTKSCGCLLVESNRKRIIKYNRDLKILRGLDPDVLIQSQNATIRDKAKDTMKAVKERDNFTCQLCKKRGGYLNSHHIIPIIVNPERSTDPKNIITLCKPCHLLAHDNNTHGPVNESIKELLQRAIENITS